MSTILKPVAVIGLATVLALAAATPLQAQSRDRTMRPTTDGSGASSAEFRDGNTSPYRRGTIAPEAYDAYASEPNGRRVRSAVPDPIYRDEYSSDSPYPTRQRMLDGRDY